MVFSGNLNQKGIYWGGGNLVHNQKVAQVADASGRTGTECATAAECAVHCGGDGVLPLPQEQHRGSADRDVPRRSEHAAVERHRGAVRGERVGRRDERAEQKGVRPSVRVAQPAA